MSFIMNPAASQSIIAEYYMSTTILLKENAWPTGSSYRFFASTHQLKRLVQRLIGSMILMSVHEVVVGDTAGATY